MENNLLMVVLLVSLFDCMILWVVKRRVNADAARVDSDRTNILVGLTQIGYDELFDMFMEHRDIMSDYQRAAIKIAFQDSEDRGYAAVTRVLYDLGKVKYIDGITYVGGDSHVAA